MTLIKKISSNIFFWGLLWGLWMVVIFLFSSMPGNPTPYALTVSVFLERKGAHIFEYAILALLSLQFFSLVYSKESLYKILTLAFVWSVFYATTDELHQFFTPFRGAMMRDVGIDIFGILLVLIPVGLLIHRKQKKTLRES